MAIPEIVKRLNTAGINDGLLRQFCLQESRNDKVVLDAISAAIIRRERQIIELDDLKVMVEEGVI